MSKNIKTYKQILESIKERKSITEQALDPKRLDKIKRLRDSNDISLSLKEIKPLVDRIVNICVSIDFDDLEYSHKRDIISFSYISPVFLLLATLKDDCKGLGSDVYDRIYIDGYDDISLEIEVDEDMLNRIDIINGLPNFMKGIGLGKKIYKKLIKDFGYISSFNGYDPSLDSYMVWNSIARDKDIFTFINDENIISFWNEIDYDIIIEKLKIFYISSGNREIDDDFLLRYNKTENELLILFNN